MMPSGGRSELVMCGWICYPALSSLNQGSSRNRNCLGSFLLAFFPANWDFFKLLSNLS